MRHRATLLLALLTIGFGVTGADGREDETVRIYVGTYTKAESEGINLLELDPESGTMELKGVVAATENPSFLALHPSEPLLFAVNEIPEFEGKPGGSVTAFRIDPDSGELSEINKRPTLGGAPCHIVVDAEGSHVLIANYSGGNVTVLPIESDGSLGEPSDMEQHEGSSVRPDRQSEPHAHSINLDGSGRFALAADLGIDKVLVYRFDSEEGTLEPNDPPSASVAPGAGPRHLDFHPNNELAFVINELDSTITALRFDPEAGTLDELQTITTIPENFEATNSTADIHVHPSGKFLYGSNRGHHSIAIYEIDEKAGTLGPLGHQSTDGESPRNFAIDPSGRYLLAANQGTDTIVLFRIDQETGLLEQTDQQVNVPAPVCIMFPKP